MMANKLYKIDEGWKKLINNDKDKNSFSADSAVALQIIEFYSRQNENNFKTSLWNN